MSIQEILISHHSHTDIGYTHEQPVVWELQSRYIDEAIEHIEPTVDWPEGSQLRWTCEVTAPVMQWLQSASSKKIDRFLKLVGSGHIEVMALYCNLTPLYDLEELHRALLPGAVLQREYGIPVRTAMNSDVNGLPWPIVDVLTDAGVTGLTMAINEHMGGAPFARPHAFRWVGPSGRSLVTYNGLHYGYLQRLGIGETDVRSAHEKLTEWLRQLPQGEEASPLLYAQLTRLDFWDNNSPQERLAPFVREWNERGLAPRLTIVTPYQAIQRISKLSERLVPEYRGDWHDYWNFGSGSSIEPLRINRRSRRFLGEGDQIGALTSRTRRDQDLAKQAWEQVMLFDEHTWGAWCSISEPDSELTRAQWLFKEGYSNQGAALSQFTRRRAVASLAERVHYDGTAPAILVYNPHPKPIVRRLRVPKSWLDPSLPTKLPHQHAWDTYHRIPKEYVISEPIELEPLGWRVVAEEHLAVQGRPRLPDDRFLWDEGNQMLTTPFYQVQLDPGRQGLASLKCRESGREWVDSRADYAFGQIALEECTSPRGRRALWDAKEGWQPRWPARRTPGSAHGPVQVDYEPGAVRLTQEVILPGMPQITWTLRAFSDRPELEINLAGHLSFRTDPWALYLVFPLLSHGTARWSGWYSTAGQIVQYDKEQLPGVCRDFVTTDTWVYLETDVGEGMGLDGTDDAHGIGAGMQIVSPDNPLFMFGGFQFGKRLLSQESHAPPWLLAWVCNNYWQTNFRAAQPGPFQQTYWLVPHTNSVDGPALYAAADQLIAQPVLHPLPRAQSGPFPQVGRFLELEIGRARLIAVKEKEGGDGLVIRLQNPGRDRADVVMRSAAFRFARAWACDAMERRTGELKVRDGSVELALEPFTTLTVELDTY